MTTSADDFDEKVRHAMAQFHLQWQADEPMNLNAFVGVVPEKHQFMLLVRLALEDLETSLLQAKKVDGQSINAAYFMNRYPELMRCPGVAYAMFETEYRYHCKQTKPNNIIPRAAEWSRFVKSLSLEYSPPSHPLPRYVPLTEDKLGEGAFGFVVRAVDTELGREIALKVLKHSQKESLFIEEARVTSQLIHPGIVPMYGLETTSDGRLSYAMRVVEGRSLDEEIMEFHSRFHDPKLSLTDIADQTFRRLLRHFVATCRVIGFAHSKGILHLDIKPANVKVGEFGETTVIDWGLASVQSRDGFLETSTETVATDDAWNGGGNIATVLEKVRSPHGKLWGTPAYMSPEQAARQPDKFTKRTDIYQLGATLCHLLTNNPPIQPMASQGKLTLDALEQYLRQVQHESAHLSPSHWVRKPLRAICLKALEKDPANRYETAQSLADDVENWLDDRAVMAYREGFITKIRRWARRHRRMVATTFVFAALIVLCVIIGNYLLKRNNAKMDVDKLLAADSSAALEIVHDLQTRISLVANAIEARRRVSESARRASRLSLVMLAQQPDVELATLSRDIERWLNLSPSEVMLYGDSLKERPLLRYSKGQKFLDSLGTIATDENESSKVRLHAACILAMISPNNEWWSPEVSSEIVNLLLSADPTNLGVYANTLRGIGTQDEPPSRLKGPVLDQLLVAFGDENRAMQERINAAAILADYYATDAKTEPCRRLENIRAMVELILRGTNEQQVKLVAVISEFDGDAIDILLKAAPQEESASEKSGELVERQLVLQEVEKSGSSFRTEANATLALLRLDPARFKWSWLAPGVDPRLSTQLIHQMREVKISPSVLLEELGKNSEPLVKRGIVLALGRYSKVELSESMQKRLRTMLKEAYTDPDPGLRSAAESVLSYMLETKGSSEPKWLATSDENRKGPVDGNGRWYINCTGKTMVVIPKPAGGVFTIGSSENEREQFPNKDDVQTDLNFDESYWKVRIDDDFAIAARETTVEDFETFLKSEESGVNANLISDIRMDWEYGKTYRLDPEGPVNRVRWEDACLYCNWLTEKENRELLIAKKLRPFYCISMPEKQTRPKITVHSDADGYRLPTEAEWEYACRSGTQTARYYGEDPELLKHYANYGENSWRGPVRVGSLLPNAWGLFDMLGNEMEWCEIARGADPTDKKTNHYDIVPDVGNRIARGGFFLSKPEYVRSAYRMSPPNERHEMLGFRVARTILTVDANN